jgi:enterochelin esterase family protein
MSELSARIRSVHLQNERTVWVREPAGKAGAGRLTVFLDGELYREKVGAVSVLEGLLAQGSIADSWFVFVSTESAEARWRECPCYPPFARFIVDELLPWLNTQFGIPGDTPHRVLAGLSYTGLAAAFIAIECPGVFQKVICQSGSFWHDDCRLVGQYGGLSGQIQSEFYLDVGLQESAQNIRHREDVLQVVSQIDGVRRFRDVLVERGISVKYVEFEGGHNFEAWRETLPEAIIWALPPGGETNE